MTDQKKPDEVGEVDWDEALAEWEDKTFTPEIAREPEAAAEKPAPAPAHLLGRTGSRPLYRPPTPTSRPIPASIPAVPEQSSIPTVYEDDDEGGEATIIARIPEELLRRDTAPRSTSRGGGLGQFFSRDAVSEAPPTKPPAPRTKSDPPEEVVTSAQAVDSDAGPAVEPLRRAPRIDASESVPDGALFDPFLEPRPEMLTLPATEELVAAVSTSPAPPTLVPPASAPPLDRLRLPSVAPVAGWAEEETRTRRAPQKELDSDSEPPEAPSSLRPSSVPPSRSPSSVPLSRSPSSVPPSRSPSSVPPRIPVRSRAPRPAAGVESSRSWPDEKPASAWLDDPARAAMQERSAWLEFEARALSDKVARARGLLTCSELAVAAGDRDRAYGLACEARDLAPSLALAHRQARALLPWPPDPDEHLQLLDSEIKLTPPGPARLHSILIAADALHAKGDDEGTGKRLDQAMRIAPTDVRAPIARAVTALGHGDLASPALRVSEAPELAPVARAVESILRLRGVATGGGSAPTPSETFFRARQALAAGDLAGAAVHLAELGQIDEIASGALWLASALGAVSAAGRPMSLVWLKRLLERADDPDAARALAYRAFELGEVETLGAAVAGPGPLTSAERVVFSALAGLPIAADDPRLDAAAVTPGMTALAAAAAAVIASPGPARHTRAAGSDGSRARIALGRRLATAIDDEIRTGLDAVGADGPAVRGANLEMASRAGRTDDVSAVIEEWGAARAGGDGDRAAGMLAAGLVAERAGSVTRALEAYKAAHALDPLNEAALRAVASLEPVNLVFELNTLAEDLGEGLRPALLRIEAVARSHAVLPEPTQSQLLEAAHRAAPLFPVAAFMAERIARRAGDFDEVVRWLRERRATSTDAVESAIDSVREALLIADHDPAVAGERLREAHLVRRSDVALRELYERMATEAVDDRAAWREQRAAEVDGDARALMALEAAHDYERVGDEDGAFRCAVIAAAGDASLATIARERAELRTGRVARLADELFATAKGAQDAAARCEAYERLAALDGTARHDTASALLWHRSVLEELPEHKPSLRFVEHHLVSEGRADELESVVSAIARALRGSGPGEYTAHAEVAARLRMRADGGKTDSASEMIALAAGEAEPSLWSLRMLEAHARTTGDDATLLDVTKRLVDRSSRSAECAALLLRAGEAAMRLERYDEARALLQRATVEDSGDIVAWWLLAEVRRRAGDTRGAAEACEALARSSSVAQHQLLAWYDAGGLWLDDVHDDERAVVALEAAAALDVSYRDVFDRLSRLYAARRMQPELADLLERRLQRVTDPEERLAIEVRRGRVLLEAGETDGARLAFQAALSSRPDDPGALSAFADLCIAQKDWNAAEQALVRLARLLPTAEEQRGVYARLGELYSDRLLNLARAEVALKEVLKRAPDDVATTQKLVDVYKRQNDPARAVDLQQELVERAHSPEERRERILELAAIHERVSRDLRRAEKTLEGARRDLPQDVILLRALADFYTRHNQTPAVHMLLDRASADARRALGAGRIAAPPFEVIAAVFELRGKRDAAAATHAMLAAVEGRPIAARGAGPRALASEFDELLAPEALTMGIRALLEKTGDALETAAPLDLRELRATPLGPDAPLARYALRAASAAGIVGLQVLTSPRVGPVCLPIGSPPTLVFGEALQEHDRERVAQFLALRALKLLRARASALGRGNPGEVAILVSAWLKAFNPTWQPQGVTTTALNSIFPRMQAALPRSPAPDVPMLALEASAALDGRQATVGFSALAWGNRAALLALGDPSTALDAIATAGGLEGGAPSDPRERAAWISRTPEARDLVAFGVTDAFAQVCARLGSSG